MKTTWMSLLCALTAQTNDRAPVWTNSVQTNYVKNWHKYRVVQGQLYDSERSYKWERFTKLYYIEPFTNGAVFQRFEKVQNRVVFKDPKRTLPTGYSISNREERGDYVVIRNYPDLHLTDEKLGFEFRAMEIGHTNFRGETVKLYDYGADHYIPVLKTNRPTKTPSAP